MVKYSLEQDSRRKAALLQRQNKAYNDFCEQNNLKKLQDRLAVAKWDRQQAAAATGAARRYENKNSARAVLKAKLADGSLTKDLNPITQAPHMYDTRKPGKSYFKQGFTSEQLQQIVDARCGTGTIRISKSGQIRETIDYERDIGIVVSSDNIEIGQTNRFTIHYSLKRTHVIPTQKLVWRK